MASDNSLSRRALMHRLGLATVAATFGNLLGCSSPRPGETTDRATGPIEKSLSLYFWSDYLADTTVPDFEREFGVDVSLDTYESNEEMVAKLLAGATGYDLVLPSSYLFPTLRANDLIRPIRRELVPNWSNLAPMFQNPEWDRGGGYSVPWGFGVTGIAYRSDKVPAPESWAVFFDERYRGKLTMLDDHRDVIGAFLRYRGQSLNTASKPALEQAKQDALRAKKNLRAYVSAAVKAQLIAGDVWIAQLWSGDAVQAAAENPNIHFVVPTEGSTIFCDTLVIPTKAPHPRAAHEFINYILRPQVGAAIADKTGYGTPNAKAVSLTRAKVGYPSAEQLQKLEYQRDLGDAAVEWDRVWTEIKAG